MLIIAGSYERLLYGLTIANPESINSTTTTDKTDKNTSATTMSSSIIKKIKKNEIAKPSFIYPAHISCIKSLACGGRFLASGSTDEHIKVYDLKLRKEVGTLMQHTGSITCLEFFGKTHLMSGSEDGNICVFRTRDWEILKQLKGHKGIILDISVHPSGKLLLSSGVDKTLRCWDLTRGVCAKTMKIEQAAEKVRWSPTGSHFVCLSDNRIRVYDLENGKWCGEWTSKQRLNNCVFVHMKNVAPNGDSNNKSQQPFIIAGGEEKTLFVISVDGKLLKSFKTSVRTRIKDLCIGTMEMTSSYSSAETTTIDNEEEEQDPSSINANSITTKKPQQYIMTCHSDGLIQVINMEVVHREMGKQADEPVYTIRNEDVYCSYSTGCRLTCMIVDSVNEAIPFIEQDDNEEEKVDYPESEAESCVDEEERNRNRSKPTITVSFDDEKENRNPRKNINNSLKKRKPTKNNHPSVKRKFQRVNPNNKKSSNN